MQQFGGKTGEIQPIGRGIWATVGADPGCPKGGIITGKSVPATGLQPVHSEAALWLLFNVW